MKVHNTLSGKKEDFVPQEKDKVGIYVCGPTVYNYIHIGNARAYVAFDTIIRYLKHKGLKVKYVRNLTDVDDKIIKKAAEENTTTEAITDKYTKAFFKDMKALGVEEPTIEPKATEHITEMIDTIKQLIERGVAYEVDGDVYFEIKKFPEYGKLSKRTLEEMLSGARVDVDKRKKNPADFALWKKAKEGEPSWPSPWGDGRPGWHIECSTMSMKYLGMGFDIHGGGQDLIFPHHENEIAQAEGATGQKPFVKYWLHNGFLNVEEEKMAKSVGNVILIKDLEEQYKDHIYDLRNDLRMLFILTHYHSPLNFSQKKIKEAAAASERIRNTLDRLKDFDKKEISAENIDKSLPLAKIVTETREGFDEAMDDDFNTPEALAQIFNLVTETNTTLDKSAEPTEEDKQIFKTAYQTIKELSEILGFSFKAKEEPGLKAKVIDVIEVDEDLGIDENPTIEQLLELREDARKNKDFEKADQYRNLLSKFGWTIEDTAKGPKLRKKI